MFNINSTLSRRNFLAGAAALGTAAALAGCSSGGSDGGSADDGKTFKIGVIGPLTGAAATYGVSAEKGAKLAAKDFSTKDLKLSLKSEDDVADGEKAINAFNTLCDWGMQALVGPVTTGAAVAVSGEIADDMLMVTPSASSLDVTKDKTTVFQVCFTDPTMGASAAKFLAEKYADAKIALFYNSGDTYSSGVADAFAEQAKASKLDIVDTETFKDDSSTSFTNQLTKAKEVRRHAHLCADLLHAGVRFAQERQGHGLRHDPHGYRRHGRPALCGRLRYLSCRGRTARDPVFG